MSRNQLFKKISVGYGTIWGLSIIWILSGNFLPASVYQFVLPVCAAAILFYPPFAVGLVCNKVTEMGRWLIGSALGFISALIFIAWYFIEIPVGAEFIGFCANGLIASALISIGTLSTACFVGKYRYA